MQHSRCYSACFPHKSTETLRGQRNCLTSHTGVCRSWCDIWIPKTFFSLRNPRAGNDLTHTGEVKPQNVRAEKLPQNKWVLCTRAEMAGNLALTLHSSQFTVLLLPKTWFLLLASFPVSLFLTYFSLFFYLLPLSSQLLVSSRVKEIPSWRGSIRLPYYFSLPLLSGYLEAGWLPLKIYYSLWDAWTREGSAEALDPFCCQARRNNIISSWEEFMITVLWFKLTRGSGHLQSNYPGYSVFVAWPSLELNGNGPHLEKPGGILLDTLALWFQSKGLISLLQVLTNAERNLWRPNKCRAESDPLI